LKKLDWFIIKSYIVPFIITFFISEMILILQFIYVYLDDIVGKGVGPSVYFELIFYAFLEAIPMALPLAILLSSIMAMGNLGERNELTAMKSAGISLVRVMRPLLFLMILIGSISFYFSNYVWGEAHLKKRILMTDLTNKKLSLFLKEGVFYNEIENYSIRANHVDKESNMLGDVLIFKHNPTFKYRQIIRAERGEMKKTDGDFLILTLYNGEINEVINPHENSLEKESVLPYQKISFSKTVQKIDISSLQLTRTSEEDYAELPRLLPLGKLAHVIDSLNIIIDTINRTKLYYYTNSYSILKIGNLQQIDSVKPSVLHFDSLFPQEKKAVLESAKNRVQNSIDYLKARKQDFKNRDKHKSKVTSEWHRKFTLSLACIILFFVGAPLGAIVKKGGIGIPIAVSIGLFVIYYLISTVGERLGTNLVLPPYIGMWLSSIILLPLGILLTYQAVTESKIFDFESYGIFFKKIGEFIKTKGLRIKTKNS